LLWPISFVANASRIVVRSTVVRTLVLPRDRPGHLFDLFRTL
jgi:hypothetical protein